MSFTQLFLILTTLIEVVLLIGVVLFFFRLKRSERLVRELNQNQQDMLEKLSLNAKLEQELVESFTQRQKELAGLDKKLQERAEKLTGLLQEADSLTRSPELLRRTILNGHRHGRPVRDLARSTGLSEEEVKLIIEGEPSE